MSPTTCPSDKVFLTAARCADCSNPACMEACPEHVDLRALFEFISEQMPVTLARIQKSQEAETYADEAINHSFE